jgi:hypothetical protein
MNFGHGGGICLGSVEASSGGFADDHARRWRGHIKAPVLIPQGLSDPLVLPSVQEAFVKQWCDTGRSLEYRTYKDRDHLSVLFPGSALIGDLVSWTQSRFSGKPHASGCTTTSE